ncbi:hypothetical protein CBL_06486 [Carabus blaptoides fortunei]
MNLYTLDGWMSVVTCILTDHFSIRGLGRKFLQKSGIQTAPVWGSCTGRDWIRSVWVGRPHISLTAGKNGLTSITVKTRFLSDENVAKMDRQHKRYNAFLGQSKYFRISRVCS